VRAGPATRATPAGGDTTTIADPAPPPARPDLIGRDFTPTPSDSINAGCSADPHLHCRHLARMAVLATVIDIASRRVVRMGHRDTCAPTWSQPALRNAITTRRPTWG